MSAASDLTAAQKSGNYVALVQAMDALARVASVSNGAGSPEGVVAAPVGAIYSRTDGGASTSLYVKESGGSGNTGWVAK